MKEPTCGILVGEPQILGHICMDGGTCYHKCVDRCFRRDCCVPLTASGLDDNWSVGITPAAGGAVQIEAGVV